MKLTALAVVVLVVAWRWWRYRNPPLHSWGPRVDPDSPGEIVRRALAGEAHALPHDPSSGLGWLRRRRT